MAEKPWLVGESNPYGGDPGFALYPEPRGCSGWRLCYLVLGMKPVEYLRRFERRNLLASARWSAPRARAAADALLLESGSAPLVLLGRKVQAAFGLSGDQFVRFGRVLLLPHPSGLCRAWNEPRAFERARAAVRALL